MATHKGGFGVVLVALYCFSYGADAQPCFHPTNVDGCIDNECLEFGRKECGRPGTFDLDRPSNGCPVVLSFLFKNVMFNASIHGTGNFIGVLIEAFSRTLMNVEPTDIGVVYAPHALNTTDAHLVTDVAVKYEDLSSTHCSFFQPDIKAGVEQVFGIHCGALAKDFAGNFSDDYLSVELIPFTPAQASEPPVVLIAALSGASVIFVALIWFFVKKKKSLNKVMEEESSHLRDLEAGKMEGIKELAKLQNEVASIRKQKEATDAELRAVDTVFGGIERVVTDIPWDALKFIKRLGHGAFGEVHLMEYEGNDVAVKLTLREHMEHEDVLQQIVQEMIFLTTLKRISHPNLVKFVGATWDEPPNVGIVLEFIPGGDLDSLIHKKREADPDGFYPDPDLSWSKNLLSVAIGIASGVRHLHFGMLYNSKRPKTGDLEVQSIDDNEFELNEVDRAMDALSESLDPENSAENPDAFLHRDLKPANIMLTADMKAKLVDLGEGRLKEQLEDDDCMTQVGTPLYQCPEISLGLSYSEKADIFSLGVVFNEMDTFLVPYANHTSYPRSHYRVVYAQDGTRPFVDKESPFKELQALIARMWDQDPKKRPSSARVVHDLKAKVAPEVLSFTRSGKVRKRRKRGKLDVDHLPGAVI